jgi:hypothetical protein
MKKIFYLFVLSLFTKANYAQTTYTDQAVSTNAIFDTVFDHLGNRYMLNNIRIDSPNDFRGQNLRPLPTMSCTAGYFDLYFASGSCFDGASIGAVNKRTAICQLFTDISNFIVSTLPPSVRINIYCDNTGGPTAGALGSASPFFVLPTGATNPNQGIADNQIQKALITGTNPFLNLPITIFPNANNFYYGYVNANPTVTWNDDISVSNIASNQYDFYSIMLHEVTHALGFYSMINAPGVSVFGSANNYFSRYDQFLFNSNSTPAPLLVGSGICPLNSLQYSGPFSQIAPGSCTINVNQDITNCATAAKYISPNLNIKVYTPNCYEAGSSLSHFEDMCSIPTGFTSTCAVTPPGSNNNLYYVMSNGNNTGNCYVKRFLKEEERYVLCDIGYKVNTNYTSLAAAAPHTYTGGACPGTNIWGLNDGINGTTYTQLTTTNTKSIPLATILGNDVGANQVSCIEVVYNNAAAAISGSNLLVTGTVGQGLVLIKYLPKNTGSGKFGNSTYIFVYFLPGVCNPINACNMVNNGSFETLAFGPCGGVLYNPVIPIGQKPRLSCWDVYVPNSPDLYTRNCNANGNLYNLGINTQNTAPTMQSFNGAPNNRIVGLGVAPNVNNAFGPYEEDMKNNLSAPLIPNTAYQISLWAYNYSGVNSSGSWNPNKSPVVITCASAPNFAASGINFPAGLNILSEFTVNVNAVPNSTLWTQFTNTFVFTGTAPDNALIIGLNPAKTGAYGLLPGSLTGYVFIDQISLLPLPTPSFAITNSVICVGSSITNLSQYASAIPGTFSGPGVTYSGSQYDFNSPPTLTPGAYPIAFTYTNNGCVNTIYQQVHIGGISAGTSTLFCNYKNYTLTAVGYPSTTSYTWLPSGQISPTTVVSGAASTSYTLLTNSVGCNQVVYTPTVVPNTVITNLPGPWCGNNANPLGVAIPNFTVPTAITQTWSVGSLTVPVIFVNYTGIINPIYTVTTSVSGCTNVASYTATWTPPFTLSASNTASSNCLSPGQSATLTATSNPAGATFIWQPGSIPGSPVIVTPASTTIYTVIGTSGACTNTATQTVVVTPPVTFTNVPTNWCTYQSIFYLENYLATGTPTGGVWNIPNLGVITTPSPGLTQVNINPNLTPLGTHTVYYTYTAAGSSCTVTNQFTINIVPGFNVNTNGQSTYCSNINLGATLSATATPPNGVTFIWMPGNLPGSNQTVYPSSQTTYTVIATNGPCTFTGSTLVDVRNDCCNATNYVSGNTIGVPNQVTHLNGGYAINQNVTVLGTVMVAGEFRMAPNVSITVPSGNAFVTDRGVHFYACNDMWDGIVVNNGGKVQFGDMDLIEDAKVAIGSNGCTTTSGYDIVLVGTVFNRNYTSISIKNYFQASTSPPFYIMSNVFTCRDFGLAPGAPVWPTASSTFPGLRAMTTPATPLGTPYNMLGYVPANLKAPYSNQTSYSGVYVENSGMTVSPAAVAPTYYNVIIGETIPQVHNNYNIFDNLMNGIVGLNAGISSYDNVFQNSRRTIFYSPRPNYRGGYGIYSTADGTYSNNYHQSLNLVATSNPSANCNSFFDCHFAVYTGYLHNVNADYVNIQSTRNANVALTTTTYGQNGLLLFATNTKDYSIKYGNFKNVSTGINLYVYWGNSYLPGYPTLSSYLGNVDIKWNLFTPTTSSLNPSIGTGGIDNAIVVNSSGMVAGITYTQAGAAMRIQYNNFDRVIRGVQNYGHSATFYTGFTANNKITLVQDPFNNQQWGVWHGICPASVVNTNTITGFGITNNLVAGVYMSQSGSSAVQCNITNTLYAGFDFNGSSPSVSLRNNVMENNKRGLNLNNGGIIGTQGSYAVPSNNFWAGNWAGSNATWTDAGSTAVNSPLWVKNSPTGYYPLFNTGFYPNQIYGVANTLYLANNAANTSSLCSTPGDPPPPSNLTAGNNNDADLLNKIASDDIAYDVNPYETAEINKMLLFKAIDENNNLTQVSDTLDNFYNSALQQEPGTIVNIEKQFASGNLATASSLLGSFSPNTNIQTNYKTYFSVYNEFVTNHFLSTSDSMNLIILAHQCPFTDGPVVYNARSLYNYIYKTVVIYSDGGCGVEGYSARSNANSGDPNKIEEMHQILKTNELKNKDKIRSNYRLYPNPAINEFYISGSNDKENLTIMIYDVSGKLLLSTKVTLNAYKSGVKLDLMNGIYFVNLSNEKGESTVKKLIISK